MDEFNTVHRNTALEHAIKGFRNQIRRAEVSDTGLLTRGMDFKNVPWHTVYIEEHIDVTDADGNFYFTPGVSIVGGDDIMRE
jgi:hypothetical protein